MLHHPEFNPVALQLGPLAIYWYGIMYLLGFAAAWGMCLLRRKRIDINFSVEQVSDLIFYAAIGVIVGGRVCYMLVYGLPQLLKNPLSLLMTWHGGMSFHGGILGVMVALWVFARKNKRSFFQVSDFLVPMVPFGLALGRFGNFINGELWGRVTTMPWGMVFPQAGEMPRHPSQLYELATEGVLLFIILWLYSSKPRPRMAVSGWFLVGYGLFRILCEFFRQPDWQIGYLAWGWVTMGQLLSLPMVILGGVMLWRAYSLPTIAANNTAL